ncbi:MAG TPA: ATP-dependent DNA helicase RecG [Candidatus Moranbacteria bacterium]|nr:ATP-dependent DNA helicase RecG [Candidatus Moranbacteria bacterium]
MENLKLSLKNISRITPKYLKTLEKMGIFTVNDFLFYFPFRYDDFSKIVPVSQDYLNQVITIEGKIKKTKNVRIFRRRLTITEIIIEDENSTSLKAVWFNQPFILETLKEGMEVRLSGKLSLDKKTFSMNSPAWEKSSRDMTNTGRLIPVYPETVGITSKWIRWQIKMLLPIIKNMPDILPSETRKKYNLYDVYTALNQIHFPDSKEKLIRAQKRFAFQEMFLVQIKTLQIKKDWEEKNSNNIKFDEKLIKTFVKNLPFKLTNAQRKASFEILKDLEKPRPMNRLLNGDVGSGKTIVAAISALQAISAGYQVAIMAPTEVLARQHFESFCKIFENYNFNIALLTNSYKLFCHCERSEAISKLNNEIATVAVLPRNDMLKEISSGKINLVIGTHALIQKDIQFKNLALVIIDEQHRFGVNQRAALQIGVETPNLGVSTVPHLLTMTATPIPRTLAIAFFGSLDLSVLDEMPKNRKPIITKIITSEGRDKVYNFIRSEIKKDRQIFIILPLIEESLSESMADVKAAKVEFERLSKEIFPEFKLGLLHGKLKAKEKEEVMQKFSAKEIDILVSTSVVEVGIDIPNATVMIIENSERFGLSQLHQFRGRVGRGENQSYCFLFSGNKEQKSLFPTRLKIMEETNDGFKISEKDLELRGPGQFFGTLQSGLPDIAMEHLGNVKLIKFARFEAQEILKSDPKLKEHSELQNALQKFSEKIHLE